MGWWSAARAVFVAEWGLLQRHRKLAWAFAGLLFVPALYALIFLYAMWDPAAHTRALPAGLLNLDSGASYRERELNLGRDVLGAIERQGQFAYRRYIDRDAARADVRQGRLAFLLEIPQDFSQRALPGEQPGAAKLTLYTSEGNNYSSAAFARRFAPEVAQRVNTMLGEARWELVLSTAAGSRKTLESLHAALAGLHAGAGELRLKLDVAREGAGQLSLGANLAADAAARQRTGASQLADGTQQVASGVRQAGLALRSLDSRRPPDADLHQLRQGTRLLLEGQRELGRGLDALGLGAGQLQAGVGQLKAAANEVPLFGSKLLEGIEPIELGASQLGLGLGRTQEGQARLTQAALRLDEELATLVDGSIAAGASVSTLAARWPDDARLGTLVEGARELARSSEQLAGGLRQAGTGAMVLHDGLSMLGDGARRLHTGLELVRSSLPAAVDSPGGSAQGLALSVEPMIEIVAPVPNNGIALTPNSVPMALWVGAVMTAFLVHFRRVPEALAPLPRTALAAGKLALPLAAVVLQALLMLAMLVGVLHVPVPQPMPFAALLVVASCTFLALVWALVRVLGDLGKVVAVLLLVVQVSAAGALLPVELSDEAFQAIQPYLPLTWVVHAFRAVLFDAYDGQFAQSFAAVAAVGIAAVVLGTLAGRWRGVPADQWRPPLDIE